jgi:hypothetical protein
VSPRVPLATALVGALAALCALGATGCIHSDPVEEGGIPAEQSFVEIATAPSNDGRTLAMVIEPRVRHNQVSGVFVGEGSSDNAGPSKLVTGRGGAGEGVTFAARDLAEGPKQIARAGKSVLVFTRADHHGGITQSVMGYRPTPFVGVERLDGDTLASSGARAFAPPLENPIGLGDGDVVLDLPRAGLSDVERDVRAVAWPLDATRAPQTLFEARGHHSVSCAHSKGAMFAFEPAGQSSGVRVVAIERRDDGSFDVTGARLEGYRLRADGAVACAPASRRIALSGTRLADAKPVLLAVDAVEGFVDHVLEGDAAAVALSADGAALLASSREGKGSTYVAKDGSFATHAGCARAPAIASTSRTR